MKELTQKQMASLGGKARWAGKTPEEISAEMSVHWKKVKKAQKYLSTHIQKRGL